MTNRVTIQKMSPHHPQAQSLITELDAYLSGLYPPESNHLDPADELSKENVLFVGAYDEGVLVGCGAVKVMAGEYGEIKRVFVKSDYRGRGIALAIMEKLEQHLLDNDIPLARLETGIHQVEAIRLYEKMGYRPCEPFGDYHEDLLSLFMEKYLEGR
jgi:putative acetyltransferase